MPGLRSAFEPIASASAKFDLSVSLSEQRATDGTSAGIAGIVEYATDLFERASVEAMTARLIRLLAAAVADADRPIGSLDILSPDERRTILYDWNATARAVPSATLPELFAAQVKTTPAATAVVFEDTSLTYDELDAHSSQLAHHLRALGVGPEVVVGLCVERSLEMLVGLLGILKAGGAYLPLDPDYPPERLAFMLADAGAPVLVTQSALRDRLPLHNARIVQLDADWPAIATRPASAPAAFLHPQHPAYVIYTSGSTGTPKGVAVTHSGLIQSHAVDDGRLFRCGQDDVVLGRTASISFDAAVWEIWLPLLSGAASCVAPREHAGADPASSATSSQRHGVNYRSIRCRRCWLRWSKLPDLDRCTLQTHLLRRRGAASAGMAARRDVGLEGADGQPLWTDRDDHSTSQPSLLDVDLRRVGASRSAVRSGTRRFMFWTIVWSLCRRGLRASYTSRVRGWRAVILGGRG